jgi:hypothetical protein
MSELYKKGAMVLCADCLADRFVETGAVQADWKELPGATKSVCWVCGEGSAALDGDFED